MPDPVKETPAEDTPIEGAGTNTQILKLVTLINSSLPDFDEAPPGTGMPVSPCGADMRLVLSHTAMLASIRTNQEHVLRRLDEGNKVMAALGVSVDGLRKGMDTTLSWEQAGAFVKGEDFDNVLDKALTKRADKATLDWTRRAEFICAAAKGMGWIALGLGFMALTWDKFKRLLAMHCM